LSRNDDNELTPLDYATENFLNQIDKDGRIFKILVDLGSSRVKSVSPLIMKMYRILKKEENFSDLKKAFKYSRKKKSQLILGNYFRRTFSPYSEKIWRDNHWISKWKKMIIIYYQRSIRRPK